MYALFLFFFTAKKYVQTNNYEKRYLHLLAAASFLFTLEEMGFGG